MLSTSAVAFSLALSSPSAARAQTVELRHGAAAVHLVTHQARLSQQVNAWVPLRVRSRLREAKTIDQQIKILNRHLSAEQIAHLDRLVEIERSKNPDLRGFENANAEALKLDTRSRVLFWALVFSGMAIPAAAGIGYRAGRRTSGKPKKRG